MAVLLLGSAHWPWLWATLKPGCTWWGPVVTQTGTVGEVWLTIDDGPDPTDTPQILDLLEARGAKATFFLIGKKAAAHPDLVREIIRRGHEVGNHTMNHFAGSFWIRGPGVVRREILDANDVLSPLMEGQNIRWFRAPAGLRNQWVHPVLMEAGLELAAWSSRGYDGVSADSDTVVSRVLQTMKEGGIVLLHEGRLSNSGDRLILRVLPRVLDEIAAKGWRCVIPR
ncbi:MAG: polysaccharide deacetylase family protein [Verrucomicrobiaceae bacterium]|nr:polysaccharide deacetylase family protein [Verrucomicrobiaceae bacterium]